MKRARMTMIGLVAAFLTAASAVRADTDDSTQVTYVAGGSVYVNAGGLHGLAANDTLELLRGGRPIGLLIVTATSLRRSVCAVIGQGATPIAGDRVRGPLGTRHAPAASGSVASTVTAPDTEAVSVTEPMIAPRPQRWLRGRAALRWFSNHGFGSELVRPMVELYVNGTRERGPLDVVLDLRAYRSRLTGSGVTREENLGRLYRASVGTRARGSGAFLVAGRQYGPGVVSLFDGVSVGWNTPRWTASLYGGSEPEPVRMQFSPDIVHSGVYVETRNPAASRQLWSARLGMAASFDHGHANRNFAFLQGSWRNQRFTMFGQQELDIAPSWRRDSGDPTLDVTNSFVTVGYAATHWLDLHGGYDARHSVRLWRDRETPETQFDDQARAGAWLGASALSHGVRASGELRMVDGGGQNDLSWNGELGWSPRVTWAPGVRARYATYHTDLTRSQLVAFTMSVNPPWGVHVEGSGGQRVYDDGLSGVQTVDWYEVVTEWSPGTRWFIHGAWTIEQNTAERMTETLAGVSVRF